MRPFLLYTTLLFLLITPFTSAFSLKVRQDPFGDLKIYFTNTRSDANLIVFMTNIRPLETKKEEIWYLDSQFPDLKISITSIKTAADIIVYLTTFQSQAGWRTQSPWKGKLYSFSHR